MKPLRRACLRTALALAAAPLLSSTPFSAHADAWPQRPIRLLVPYGPGGSSDVVARAVAVEMSRDLGQQVIVENKGGGQGSIATVEAARARPDGYTLILGHVGTLAVNPTMMPNLSYDPRRDFAPIILLAKLPMVFAVGAKVPAATLPEFVALARARPGVLNYGSAGNGSAGHLAFEMLKTAAAIDVVHVPYKGTGAQVTDLLAGNIDAAAAGIPGLLPHAQAGKIKIVAARPSACQSCRTCPPWPSRATPASKARSGSACWPRPARRRKRSRACRPPPSAPCRPTPCASAWPMTPPSLPAPARPNSPPSSTPKSAAGARW